jgi:CRP-like cAMP-binding protein
MRKLNLKAGDVLFRKGDPADDAYLIIDGVIKISGEKLNATVKQSEIFGESGLVGNPRMADALALTDCRLMAFSVDELRIAIRTQPDTAEALVEAMIRRLTGTVKKLENVPTFHT